MTLRRNFIQSITTIISLSPFIGFMEASKQRKPLSLIIDADTANEVDDLFAIVRALIEPNLKVEALTAAQWHTSPQAPNDSVSKSHEMNQEILELMDKTHIPVAMGANAPLTSKVRPQPSNAAALIVEKVQALPKGEKLAIAVLGPCTNVASAVLMAPEIIPKIAVHYIGFWYHLESNTWNKREFNTNNDPNAVDVLLDALNLDFNVMTATTSQHLVFSKNEVDDHLKNEDGVANYLLNRWETFDRWWQKDDLAKTKWIMWDVAIIEALANPELARKMVVQTPHDNLLRDIHTYTSIDVEGMKRNYWSALDMFLKK